MVLFPLVAYLSYRVYENVLSLCLMCFNVLSVLKNSIFHKKKNVRVQALFKTMKHKKQERVGVYTGEVTLITAVLSAYNLLLSSQKECCFLTTTHLS